MCSRNLLPFRNTNIHPVLKGIRLAQSFVLFAMFCESLFVLSSFFRWPLYCLSFSIEKKQNDNNDLQNSTQKIKIHNANPTRKLRETVYTSEHLNIPLFCVCDSCCSIFKLLFTVLFFVLFHLYLHRCTVSDYPFGIFNFYLITFKNQQLQSIHTNVHSRPRFGKYKPKQF